jgi:hypothetical protein
MGVWNAMLGHQDGPALALYQEEKQFAWHIIDACVLQLLRRPPVNSDSAPGAALRDISAATIVS